MSVGCGGNSKYPSKTIRDVNVDVRLPETKIMNFVRADALFLPFRDKAFDRVFSSHLIEHLEEPYAFMIECRRIGRRVELVFPHYLNGNAYCDPDHKVFYCRGRFLKINRLAGRFFSVFFQSRHFRWDRPRSPFPQETKIVLSDPDIQERKTLSDERKLGTPSLDDD